MESINCLGNSTGAVEFFILGFQVSPTEKPILFLVFFTIYIIIVTMNLLIVTTVSLSESLHTPMYFFLVNLSLLDMTYPTFVIPTLLGSLKEGFSISLSTCITQFFSEAMLGTNECLLLTVMAYDRYVAICNPLHYMTTMGWGLCIKLVIAACVVGFINSFGVTFVTFTSRFSSQNEIDHFYCDLAPLLKVACSDMSLAANEIVITTLIITTVPIVLIVASYICIISSILRIPSASGRSKAFSTCSSHLIVVITYFGTILVTYGTPTTGYSQMQNKMLSFVYTVVTAVLNPFIYTVRNKEIINAYKRLCLKTGDKLNKHWF